MAKKTIKVRCFVPVVEEAIAEEVISPGALIERIAGGNVQNHSTSTGVGESMFATEDEFAGKTIDDDYAAGAYTQCLIARPGDVVYAWLAAGQTAVIGSKLASDGAGGLTVSATNPVAVAIEAVDLDGVSENARILVNIL